MAEDRGWGGGGGGTQQWKRWGLHETRFAHAERRYAYGGSRASLVVLPNEPDEDEEPFLPEESEEDEGSGGGEEGDRGRK